MKKNLVKKLLLGATLALNLAGCKECDPVNQNHAPYIETIPIIYVDEGTQATGNFETGDVDGDSITHSLTGFSPELISVNSATGQYSITAPLVNADTDFNGRLEVSDGIAEPVSEDFTIRVRNIPEPPPVTPPEEPPIEPPTEPPIEQYIPTLNLTGLNADFNEDGQLVLYLPVPQDANLEDNPVPYTRIKSLTSEKITASLNILENKLTIIGKEDEIGDYQLELEFGSAGGGIGTATLEGKINDLLDVEGYFKELDTDSAAEAVIKIFDKNSTTPIAQTVSNASNGYFSVHSTNKKVSDLSGVVIEAAVKENGVWKSFLVRENFPAGDVTISEPLRAKLFPNYCTPSEFKTFMNQINMSSYGLTRFDLNNLQGVEILRGDPLNRGFNFTLNNQNFIEDKINNPGDIGLYVGEKDLNGSNPGWVDVQIDMNDPNQDPPNKHYTLSSDRKIILDINSGWIIIFPNNIGGGQVFHGYLNNNKSTGIINRAIIDLGVVNNAVTTHEFGHVFIASNPGYDGHCNIPPFYNGLPPATNTLTIMTPNNLKLPPPGVADIDARKIEYNYPYFPGKMIDDILGQTFSDGESVY